MIGWGIERAIQQGIDSARANHKNGEAPYHLRHPLFPFYWTAVVTKSDCRDLDDKRIRQRVLEQCKYRGGE